MKKRVTILLAATALLLLLSAEESSGSFFSSLQFARDSLMDFSRGSKKTTTTVIYKIVSYTKKLATDKLTSLHKAIHHLGRYIFGSRPVVTSISPPTKLIPVTETVVTYQRSSPSNKFLEAINDIERAVVNAKASGIKYSNATLAKLKSLVERAVRNKSYKYARKVLGQIMYLLSARPVPKGRRKRSTKSEGSKFLQDLRQRVGSDTFDSFLGVKGDVSLMFAIDNTGSMSSEIQAAKKIATDIINYPREAPIKEYILSPFNDPYPLPGINDPVIIELEGEGRKFTEEINKLRAHKGGDCPEYTLGGILGALHTFTFVGPLYVFTDAGPKDATPDKIEEAKMLAVESGVTINFLATGTCGSRGYRKGDPRNLHPAFLDLAKSTSGLAMLFEDYQELKKVSNLTSWIQEGSSVVSVGSALSTPNRKKRSADVAADSVYSIPVDESITKLSVTVSTTGHGSRGHGITLKDPANVIVTSEKLALSRMTIYQLVNPKRGVWTLTISASQYSWHEFLAKSSSETNTDFQHYFLIPLLWRKRRAVEVPISNPVVGKLNKIIINVARSENVVSSSLRLQLITTEGSHIKDVALQPHIEDLFIANFTPRALGQTFKLKLKGTTRGGYQFERISRQTIKSTKAILRGHYASNDYTLPLNRTTFIHFQLCNFGADELFDVAFVKDTLRYVLPAPRRRPRRVKKNRCVIISFYAKATRSRDVGKTDSVFVIVKGRSSRVAVSQIVQVLVDK